MAIPPDRSGWLELSAAQLQHPDLLTELERWVQLGLLSPTQVQQFCQAYLSCVVLPAPVSQPFAANDSESSRSADSIESPIAVPDQVLDQVLDRLPEPIATAGAVEAAGNDFANAGPAIEPRRRPTRRRPVPIGPSAVQSPVSSGWIGRSLQTLMAEISVIWLLCLGVFMVVVSSGVLAASQWRNVSAVGQYGILLAYTLAFWAVSGWTGRQPSLQLTTRMLQLATLLIIPVNFWMMDGLHLWRSPIGVGVCLLAGLMLTGITGQLLPRLMPEATIELKRELTINSWMLSGLHWGWMLPSFPIGATYLGTIGTALFVYRLTQRSSRPARATLPAGSSDSPSTLPLLPLLIVSSAVLLLIGRALLAAAVPLSDLGLALGICGWLFCWLGRADRRSQGARIGAFGAGLLLLGWAVSVGANPPWQAIIVSGLGLWIASDRLWSRRFSTDLMGCLAIGLQTYSLFWRLIPAAGQQAILTTAANWFGQEGMPLGLLGVAGLPYLWLMVGVSAIWQRQNQPRLVKLTEGLAIGLGALLIVLGWINPWTRFITLAGLAVTLVGVLQNRWRGLVWIYLCHGLIVAAGLAGIAAQWTDLSTLAWARILLGLMAIEWGLSLGQTRWQQSAWHGGLGFAGLSYGLLASIAPEMTGLSPALIWLITPGLLSSMAIVRRRRLAATLSSAALLAALMLFEQRQNWLWTAGVAIGLMALNTWVLHRQVSGSDLSGSDLSGSDLSGSDLSGSDLSASDLSASDPSASNRSDAWRSTVPIGAAGITIGWVLGFEALACWQFLPNWLTFDRGMLLWAIQLWLLWWIWEAGRRSDRSLIHCYGVAANGWAIGLSFTGLSILSLYGSSAYFFPEFWPISGLLIGSGAVLAAAIGYRVWRSGSEWGNYAAAWAIGLLLVLLIGWSGIGDLARSIEVLALGLLGFGLGSQLVGDWLAQRSGQYRSSWHGIPLLYGGIGLALAHHSWTATTGLYTLAAALIVCGVGRRSSRLQPLTWLGLLLRSLGLYELLVYRLMQTEGAIADGLVILAGLAIGLAVVDRLGSRFWLPYLRLEPVQLRQVAHLHWLLGSSLVIWSLLSLLSNRGAAIGLGVLSVCAGYALVQGRSDQPGSESHQDGWVYAGLLETILGLAYGLVRWIPNSLWLGNWAGSLAVGGALLLYFLPWRSWGWRQPPWRQMALLLPGGVVLLTLPQISLQSLLMGAAFYAWIAKTESRPRLSYLSLLLLDWSVLRFLSAQDALSALWIGGLLSGSLLFVAQIDPALQATTAKEQRHWLRSLAVLLLSLTLFYQAEITPDPALGLRLLNLGWGMGLVLAGLGLRVRAFLYVGTLTFVGQVLRILWLFIRTESLLLWAIGIVIGLLLIWIAATFEARRSQMNALMQYWLSELENWE